ncbi:hypothetical protein KFK09_008680 [Dendrobium nobile]|uniref:Uncharacterized protein n=1 Tax=Dendrobium nobile TaxID=94219 RepID=A0A8T3BNG6_DENNO|nr:hypothetical protein KFK09_008680 [Dendrobium nobile]
MKETVRSLGCHIPSQANGRQKDHHIAPEVKQRNHSAKLHGCHKATHEKNGEVEALLIIVQTKTSQK